MKPLILFAAIGAGLALAGCEDRVGGGAETAPAPLEAESALSAENQAVPAADPGVPADLPPADAIPQAPDQKSSDQTVQPESETLFY